MAFVGSHLAKLAHLQGHFALFAHSLQTDVFESCLVARFINGGKVFVFQIIHVGTLKVLSPLGNTAGLKDKKPRAPIQGPRLLNEFSIPEGNDLRERGLRLFDDGCKRFWFVNG